jgi:hypothetical protein
METKKENFTTGDLVKWKIFLLSSGAALKKLKNYLFIFFTLLFHVFQKIMSSREGIRVTRDKAHDVGYFEETSMLSGQ